VEVVSYRVAGRWTARVYHAESDDVVARGRGATRQEAERAALDGAALLIELQQARSAIRRGLAMLPGHREPGDKS
jgi:hypothetical protein